MAISICSPFAVSSVFKTLFPPVLFSLLSSSPTLCLCSCQSLVLILSPCLFLSPPLRSCFSTHSSRSPLWCSWSPSPPLSLGLSQRNQEAPSPSLSSSFPSACLRLTGSVAAEACCLYIVLSLSPHPLPHCTALPPILALSSSHSLSLSASSLAIPASSLFLSQNPLSPFCNSLFFPSPLCHCCFFCTQPHLPIYQRKQLKFSMFNQGGSIINHPTLLESA